MKKINIFITQIASGMKTGNASADKTAAHFCFCCGYRDSAIISFLLSGLGSPNENY
jgi:hypothetical protein